jgi:hypothetical protein
MTTNSHTHQVGRWHGVWACTGCPAAWQRYRMIPPGSLVTMARFQAI